MIVLESALYRLDPNRRAKSTNYVDQPRAVLAKNLWDSDSGDAPRLSVIHEISTPLPIIEYPRRVSLRIGNWYSQNGMFCFL